MCLVPTETDSLGRYTFHCVRPGRYSLLFMAFGFTFSPMGRDSHVDPHTQLSETFEVGMHSNMAGPCIGVVPI